jgi:hypothetical protein
VFSQLVSVREYFSETEWHHTSDNLRFQQTALVVVFSCSRNLITPVDHSGVSLVVLLRSMAPTWGWSHGLLPGDFDVYIWSIEDPAISGDLLSRKHRRSVEERIE